MENTGDKKISQIEKSLSDFCPMGATFFEYQICYSIRKETNCFNQNVTDSFHLCLFDFPLIYQFYSIMTTLVRTICWNPAELIIWKSFHHHFKRIWWGLLIEIEMQLFLLSLLKYSETSSQMITFNHFRCHLSYFSSYK